MPAELYIGTSSWAEKALVDSGRFYPEDVKDTPARLEFYSQRFNFAEIDSTYYALPSKKNIQRWSDSVPEGFRFNVKAFALFTQHPTRLSSIPKSFHEDLPEDVRKKTRTYYKDVPENVRNELWGIFRGALKPMREAGTLSAILIDFPPWYGPSTANREYLAHAREYLPDDNVIVEFRNRRWVDNDADAASTFELPRDLNYGFVCVDEPPGLKTSFPPAVTVTAASAAVRFRGRNAKRWEDKTASTLERFDWLYSEQELTEWLPRIEQLRAESDSLYLGFSTKADDQGVVNAAHLQKLLGLE